MTTEEASQNYLLARRRFFFSPSTDEGALREFEDASDLLPGDIAEGIENVAAEACKAYRSVLVREDAALASRWKRLRA
jgi:hypothetical protein